MVGKTWSLHLEKVTRVDPEENLRMIADSVAFLRAQGKRVVYDAEHFFDAWAGDSDYALRCLRAAVEAGAENVTLCDTNGATLPTAVGDAVARVVAEFGEHVQVGIHTHDDAGVGVANSLVAVERGARMVQGTMNGYGERCGNANLVTILGDLQLKLGYDCVDPGRLERLAEISHLVDELCNVAPNPDQPYVGANAFAHKGGMHVAGVNRDARTFEHIDPSEVGADRRLLISELSGRGTVQARADQTGVDLGADGAARVSERVKELEHKGYHLEAADGSFDLLIRREAGVYEPLFRLESWRCIVEKRQDGKVETEATIKIWVDGERYVRTAEGNGPVHALDKALRDAIGETYPHLRDIELVNFKVRILDETKGTGAVTRVLLDASDGAATWGAIGVSENVIEASWEALVDSLEAGHAARPGGPHASRGRAVSQEPIPLARPYFGDREEELVLQTLRSRQVGIGPRVAEFEEQLGRWLGAPHVSAISSGTAALHLAVRASGIEPGDEVVTSPFSFVASANCVLYENATPVFCDIDPRTLNIAPDAAAAAVTDRTTGLLPVHIFGYPVDMPGFERLAADRGLWIVEDACEALGGVHADGTAVGARGNPATFGFYPNKQLATGEGGALVSPDEASRAGWTASATRAGRPTWAGSTTTGWATTTGSPRWRVRWAWRSWSAWRRCWPAGPGSAELYGQALAGDRGPGACPARTRAATAAAGSSTWSSCRREPTATRRSTPCASRASTPSPTCRRST